MCFDNIRMMRQSNPAMADSNDDTALGDQFDEVLTLMISNLTEQLKTLESASERGRAVISGKRDLMSLLVEKTLEYQRVVDPQAEIVLQELATQYENLIDAALSLSSDGSSIDGSGKSPLAGAQAQRQLMEKDREIKQLKQQLTNAQSAISSGVENGSMRKKVKDLELEN